MLPKEMQAIPNSGKRKSGLGFLFVEFAKHPLGFGLSYAWSSSTRVLLLFNITVSPSGLKSSCVSFRLLWDTRVLASMTKIGYILNSLKLFFSIKLQFMRSLSSYALLYLKWPSEHMRWDQQPILNPLSIGKTFSYTM